MKIRVLANPRVDRLSGTQKVFATVIGTAYLRSDGNLDLKLGMAGVRSLKKQLAEV
jgi:hypothetical protein